MRGHRIPPGSHLLRPAAAHSDPTAARPSNRRRRLKTLPSPLPPRSSILPTDFHHLAMGGPSVRARRCDRAKSSGGLRRLPHGVGQACGIAGGQASRLIDTPDRAARGSPAPQARFGLFRERTGRAAARADVLCATAARTSACNAFSLILSPSWISMARLTLPSRLEL